MGRAAGGAGQPAAAAPLRGCRGVASAAWCRGASRGPAGASAGRRGRPPWGLVGGWLLLLAVGGLRGGRRGTGRRRGRRWRWRWDGGGRWRWRGLSGRGGRRSALLDGPRRHLDLPRRRTLLVQR